jgi:protocatechuate 3,4-dioxygenase beta subunit
LLRIETIVLIRINSNPTLICMKTSPTCGYTPIDTIDYLPPIIANSTDATSTICNITEDTLNQVVSNFSLSVDSGIPPYFLSNPVIGLNLTGKIYGSSSMNGVASCQPIYQAEIIAWQADVTYTDRTDATSSSSSSSFATIQQQSCRGQQYTEEDGSYSFLTTIPLSYGPPRHINLYISAVGFVPLVTRIYFDKDYRLQQLTTLQGNPLEQEAFHTQSYTFPGKIAQDRRVGKLMFHDE